MSTSRNQLNRRTRSLLDPEGVSFNQTLNVVTLIQSEFVGAMSWTENLCGGPNVCRGLWLQQTSPSSCPDSHRPFGDQLSHIGLTYIQEMTSYVRHSSTTCFALLHFHSPSSLLSLRSRVSTTFEPLEELSTTVPGTLYDKDQALVVHMT